MNKDAALVGQSPDLAVILPTWNERENLEFLLLARREAATGLGLAGEIDVVDGGSHDGRERRPLRSWQPW